MRFGQRTASRYSRTIHARMVFGDATVDVMSCKRRGWPNLATSSDKYGFPAEFLPRVGRGQQEKALSTPVFGSIWGEIRSTEIPNDIFQRKIDKPRNFLRETPLSCKVLRAKHEERNRVSLARPAGLRSWLLHSPLFLCPYFPV